MRTSKPESAAVGSRWRWVGAFAALGACSFGPPIVVFALAAVARGTPDREAADDLGVVLGELPLFLTAVAALLGAVLGAVLGWLLACALSRRSVRRLPVPAVLLGVATLGAGSGQVIGLFLELVSEPDCGCERYPFELNAAVTSVLGAAQAAWFLIPFARRLARGQRTWPLLAGALGLALLISCACLRARVTT